MKDGLGRVQSLLLIGGDSDIGIATATAFVARGTGNVILAGRDPLRLEERASALRTAGAKAVEVMTFDADAVDEHAAFFDAAFSRPGGLDLVIVAAAVLGDQATAERDPAAIVAIARTNSLGAVSAMAHAAERLRQQGQGTLVLFSSVAGQRPRRSNFIYGSSKAGVDAFAEGLAFALRDQGVQVLTVRPGFVRTKMTAGLKPAPFSTTPEAVAAAVVRGVTRGEELIWCPPLLRYVMIALKLVPRPIFRKLKI